MCDDLYLEKCFFMVNLKESLSFCLQFMLIIIHVIIFHAMFKTCLLLLIYSKRPAFRCLE